MSKEASYYNSMPDKAVRCTLCPHNCRLAEGKTGICRVRRNEDGKLVTDDYGFVSAIHSDPIEKKPLYHFLPGSQVLSLGTYGCNLHCFFCQNCGISQTGVEPGLVMYPYTPAAIISKAKKNQPAGIAFTYNEPVVWFEYMLDIARLAKASNLVTVMVTNGFINPQPLAELLPYIDAFSVDLKAFTPEFYRKVTASELEPVKQSIKQIYAAGRHLELVNLVIPGLNDDERVFGSMVRWIASELDRDVPLHLSRYYPQYKMTAESTPANLLYKLQRIALKELTYVYTGNIAGGGNNTHCKKCSSLLIDRIDYSVTTPGLDPEGNCMECGEKFLKKT